MDQAPLVDTHAHLYLDVFAQDRKEVLARARQAGVRAVLIPAVDVASAQQALWLAEQLSSPALELFVAVGVHPNLVAQTWQGERTLQRLRELVQHPRVVAVGEIGLDFYRKNTSPEQQYVALQAQLELAAETGLPVVLHQRASIEALLDVLEDWAEQLPSEHPRGVLHSFSGEAEHARRAVALGFAVGITGPVTFKNGQRMRSVVQTVALDHLLIETDAPFLAPVPYRGRRNEPAWVRQVALKIAELKQVPLGEVALRTTHHAIRRFRLPLM